MRLYAVWAIFRKDLTNLRRNRAAVLGLLVPLFFSLIIFVGFSLVSRVYQERLDDATVRIIATNPDHLSILQLIGMSGTVAPTILTTTLHTEEVYAALNQPDSRYSIGIIMPAGLADSLAKHERPQVQLIFNRTALGTALQNYVTSRLNDNLRQMADIELPYTLSLNIINQPTPLPFALATPSLSYSDTVVSRPPSRSDDPMATAQQLLNRLQEPDAANQFGQGIFVLFGAIYLSLTLAPELLIEEKDRRTMTMLLTSPARPVDIIAAKSLLGFLYVATSILPVFLFTWSLYRQPLVALGFTALGCLYGVGLGLIMGALFNNIKAAQIWATLVLVIVIVPAFAAAFLEATSFYWVLGWWPTYQMLHGIEAAADGSLTLLAAVLDLGFSLLYISLVFSLAAFLLQRRLRRG